MKYFTLILLLTSVPAISATTDPYKYSDTLHGAAKQIVKFNKNSKSNSKFFGREKLLSKRGGAIKSNAH